MTRPDYCPVAQEPCQALCAFSDVRCKIRDTTPQPKHEQGYKDGYEAGWTKALNEAYSNREQEPVAWLCQKANGHFDVLTDQTCKKCFPVYTTPQQRLWVDLTDDEMLMIYGQQHEGKKYSLGRMVQQALKEKNT